MARTRQIKPDFFTDEDLAALSAHARLLFVGLWTLADRRGRLEERPQKIKACIFTYEDVLVDHLLEELASPKQRGGNLILRYENDGRKYIQVFNFERHQNCHPKEPESTIPGPAPAAKGRGKSRRAADKRGETVTRNAVPSVPSVPSVTSSPSGSSFSPAPASPDAIRVDGSEPRTEDTAEVATRTALLALGPPPWSREAADDFRAAYHGPPPTQFFAQLKPLVRKYGWERTRPALRDYMAETELDYLAIPKVLAVRIEASGGIEGAGGGARASPRTSAERRQAAANAMIRGGLSSDRPGLERGTEATARVLSPGGPDAGDGEAPGRLLPRGPGTPDR